MRKFSPLPSKKAFYSNLKLNFPRLAKSTYYKLYNKILREKNMKSFSEMMEELNPDYDMKYYPEDLEKIIYPKVLIITNHNMKALYAKYGKCTSFDLTFSLFK